MNRNPIRTDAGETRPFPHPSPPGRPRAKAPLPLYLGEKSSLLSMYHICLYILTEFVPPPDFARKSRRSPIFAPKMVQNLPEGSPLDASAGSLDDSGPKTGFTAPAALSLPGFTGHFQEPGSKRRPLQRFPDRCRRNQCCRGSCSSRKCHLPRHSTGHVNSGTA